MPIHSALSRAEEASQRAGIQLTVKRKNVLAVLMAAGRPLSAYELANLYQTKFDQPIPPMSVYRMLDFLTEANLAHKLSSENKFICCAHSTCDHSHGIPQFLICEKCDKVKEIAIDNDVFEELHKAVNKAGFTMIKPQLELKCLCDACAQAAES